jgi:hypothetical protein
MHDNGVECNDRHIAGLHCKIRKVANSAQQEENKNLGTESHVYGNKIKYMTFCQQFERELNTFWGYSKSHMKSHTKSLV